ncbi:hypothetical protein QRO11_03565 [Paracidovorax citrulli]|uniref:hypothetical protein n=1 Tax=Paracidovorax citrulli TaxID=80869 RepID=UPI000887762D|nr:hypothetical protein [Paracidovorax citrulli]UMT89788.1 hypothetical protein FRC90_18080 [Paracidovorax citrulli]WIY35430.1 hypothetical protein QRO11_03565 [Paracidovorax citrulli]SDJ07013.1 hypothetical protein SAMN04489709_101149 [Paracidovorax citrulli]
MAHTHPTAASTAPQSEALRCAEWLEHIAQGGDVVTIEELARTAAAELRSLDALTTNGLAWAIHRWEDEVKHRPLINVHRRSLDGAWRQVVRYFGGSPETLLGPSHDELVAAPQAAEPAPTEPAAPAEDADGRAFRAAARLGLTLRMHGGCAQSGMPGSPSAYEVVDVADRAEAMREAVACAEAVIAAGGESQRLQQASAAAAAPALLEGRAHLTYTLTAESGYEQTGEHHNITPEVFGAMIAALHSSTEFTNEVLATEHSTALAEHAARYEWLRSRDLDTIQKGGVFAGKTPDNVVLNGADLDAAIDAAIAAQR